MAEYCDLVDDSLAVNEGLAFAVGQNVPDYPSPNISDAAQQAVFVRWSDSLDVSDVVVEMWTSNISDSLNIGDAHEDRALAVQLLSDGLLILDAIGSGVVDAVSDSLDAGDDVSMGVAHDVSDSMAIDDAVSSALAAVSLLRDALLIGDEVQSGFSVSVSDSLNVGDAIEQRLSLISLSTDSMNISDDAQVIVSLVSTVGDSMNIGDALAQALSAVSVISDSLDISDASAGGGSAAWTAHVEPFAMSRYTNYGFTSLAEVDGKLMATGPEGIFLLEGDKDAGVNIDALVRHDLSDKVEQKGEMVSDPHHKRPRYAYISYRSPGQISIEIGYVAEKVGGGWEEKAASYTFPAMNASQLRNGRVPLGRGIRSRYLRQTLKNVSGATFSAAEGGIVVESVDRKI